MLLQLQVLLLRRLLLRLARTALPPQTSACAAPVHHLQHLRAALFVAVVPKAADTGVLSFAALKSQQ